MSVPIKKEPGQGTSSSRPGSVGPAPDIKKEPPTLNASGETVSAKAQLASKIKLTLMQAWRERWTEIQWAIQLKKLMAAYSAENVDIAEILMQQALVGSSPNSLILSYLKHSVLSLMIPFHTVLKYITEFDDFSRPYCVLALLHLAEMFGSKISLSPCQDSPLQLVRTMLKLVHWLVKALLTCMQRVQENRQGQVAAEYFVIMDNSSRAITNVLERRAVRSLLQIARVDKAEEYREFDQCMMNARSTMNQLPASSLSEETSAKITTTLSLLTKLEEPQLINDSVLEVVHSPIHPTINGLVALEAVLNTSGELQPFVDQILLVSRLMKIPMPQLCLEIFRACFMGFVDTNEFSEDLLWATFTFLKVPIILHSLSQQVPEWEIGRHVEKGLNMLLEYSNLLDQTDIKENFDMLGQFLTELQKKNILSEEQTASFQQKRSEQRSRLRPLDISGSGDGKNLSRVTAAEATVDSIVRSLDSDPQRNSESLVKVLTYMLHSFDHLRLAAACTGRLRDFMTKLIRINELASQTSNEAMRISNRNQLFDVTFLMIITTLQQHGLEIARPNRENENSLVVQWAKRWLPEQGKYKNCELVAGEEQDKVDYILNLVRGHSEIVPSGPIHGWRELIMLLPYALQEVLYAVEHMSLSMDTVSTIVDHIRRQNVKILTLVSTAYLCSYMNLVGANARQKPLRMLELLTTSSQGNEIRQSLQTILDNVMFYILPEGHPQRPVKRYLLTSMKLTSEILHETLRESFARGWINMASIHKLEQLISLRGTDWFCGQMVEHLLKQSHTDDTSQSLSLAFAIMHMDLERMTVSLLRRVLPRLLTSPQTKTLTDPRGYFLAKLCVLSVTATQRSKIGQKEPYVRGQHKRSVMEFDLDDEQDDWETSPAKLRKLSEPQLTLSLEEFNLDALADKEDGDSVLAFDMKDPLNKALANLFLMMNAILQSNSLTPRTWFIVSFIQEAVRCGGQHTRYILQFMPPNMLNQLMRSLPGVFSDEHILRICDLSVISGRKVAAKAICNNATTTPLNLLD